MTDLDAFESCRPSLVALAYRMLGDVGRAEDVVQEAWLKWQGRRVEVEAPQAYLVKTVTNLCLNELASARARREESRGDRLPEPVDLSEGRLGQVEALDQISMAFMVVLQRLTPAERAVLLLHDVFDFSHGEIAAIVEKTEPACRQLLRRARDNVARERRVFSASREEHVRLLSAFVAAVTPQGSNNLAIRTCDLNGQPAVVVLREGRPYTAILLAVADGEIRHVFIHADQARLPRLVRACDDSAAPDPS